jgi:hypothetical protein
MKIRGVMRSIILPAIVLVFASVAAADTYWTDWLTASTPGVQGTINIGESAVNVSFNGAYSFAQTTGGTNYWNPATPYLSTTVINAPLSSDIIALNDGGTATITFSQAVQNPIFALASWNGVSVDFGAPIQFLSFGAGYWGNGIPIVDSTGFYSEAYLNGAHNEVHGAILLPGTFTSITFTHTTENWHGFTLGALGLGNLSTESDTMSAPVPEPTTLLLLGFGLIGIAGYGRKR